MKTYRGVATQLLALALMTGPGAAQDPNILMTVDSIETLLVSGDFDIVVQQGSRFEGDRTTRTALSYSDGTMMLSKWAPAPPGGEAFNNVPRFEIAAYEIQELFLDPAEYVVPPTVARAFPVDWYRELDPNARATFRELDAVLVVLQYWLFNVSNKDFWDRDRFEADTVYARHFGNFNVLTHLIRHGDENVGNYLISRDSANPRVFSVDNGIAFSSKESDRGHRWRRMEVDRLPASTVERLRGLTEEELIRQLETVAQFRIEHDGTLTRVPSLPAVDPHRGIRRTDEIVQLGLTRREIRDVWQRLDRLLAAVDDGEIETF
jgi:hypothetical protein